MELDQPGPEVPGPWTLTLERGRSSRVRSEVCVRARSGDGALSVRSGSGPVTGLRDCVPARRAPATASARTVAFFPVNAVNTNT